MRPIAAGTILTALLIPNVEAVLLDCEISAERIYTCVEIGESTPSTDPNQDAEAYGDEYRQYMEQAKQHCVYSEPRRRIAGKNTGGALRMEELKSAREEYEQCLTDTARKLWQTNHTPDR